MIVPACFTLALSASNAFAPAVLESEQADMVRIRAHLCTVEAELRTRDASTLSPPALSARRRALDELHAYWLAGVFPQGQKVDGPRIPIFIDREGRSCAMAALIQASGAHDLALEISRTENLSRVLDMQTDLGPWLAENGLTAEEAQRIQPSYCHCSNVYNPVCAALPTDGGVQEFTFQNLCVFEKCFGGTSFDKEQATWSSGECESASALDGSSFSEEPCTCEPSNDPTACSSRLARHEPNKRSWTLVLILVSAIFGFVLRRRGGRR